MTTVVLIPGLLSDDIVWQPVADALSADFAIHKADLRQGTSIDGMARDLLGATDGLLFAVGHSMGGRIAMEMAHQAPERIAGLVLANTGHHPRREGEEAKRQAMIDLGHESMEKLADTWLPPMVDPARVSDETVMGALRTMVLRADADMHERQMRALLGRPNASAYLGEIRCPVLLIAASQDGWSPIAQHEEIAAAVHDSEIAIIEDAGHFAPVERPDEVVAAITTWIARFR